MAKQRKSSTGLFPTLQKEVDKGRLKLPDGIDKIFDVAREQLNLPNGEISAFRETDESWVVVLHDDKVGPKKAVIEK